MAEAEKDDWLDELDTPEEKASELDQSDLDALLSDSFDSPKPAAAPPAPSEGDKDELDQSAIDAMFSGSDESPPAPTPQAAAPESNDLDQSDIETLLASPQNPIKDQAASDPDQDEIDKLFSDAEPGGTAEENPFQAEDVDLKDAFSAIESPTASSPKSVNLDFDAEEFKLDDDIPDIPDTLTQGFGLEPPPSKEGDSVAAAPAAPHDFHPESSSEATIVTNDSRPPATAATGYSLLHNRKIMAGLGAGLAMLLIAGGVFFWKGGVKSDHNETAPKVAVQPPSHEAKPQESVAVIEHEPAVDTPAPHEQPVPEAAPAQPHHENAAPTVKDLDLTVPPESNQLAITLSGSDPENEALLFVMSLPENGQLTGHAPNLIYTPNPGFSGQDGFVIMATDGKNASTPATVRITRQPPPTPAPTPAEAHPPVEAAKAAEAKPSEPVLAEPSAEVTAKTEEAAAKEKAEIILAKNRSYTLTGSKGQLINWEKIWRAGNFAPFNQDVKVDIVKAPRHGTIKTLTHRQSLYTPESGFRGTDTFTYRFSLGKLTSKTMKVSVAVQRKKVGPSIRIQPIAPSYETGDTVILNASQSKTDGRSSLTFRWEQLAGAPLSIKPLNSEGSQVSFVVPATFNTVANPSVLLRVTATDKEGMRDSQEIRVETRSRRTSAIWGQE